jgi:hypothetical protein
MLSKILSIMTHLPLMRKDVNQSKKMLSYFPTCVKLGVGSAWHCFDANPDLIWSGIKTMPIHNTDLTVHEN